MDFVGDMGQRHRFPTKSGLARLVEFRDYLKAILTTVLKGVFRILVKPKRELYIAKIFISTFRW